MEEVLDKEAPRPPQLPRGVVAVVLVVGAIAGGVFMATRDSDPPVPVAEPSLSLSPSPTVAAPTREPPTRTVEPPRPSETSPAEGIQLETLDPEQSAPTPPPRLAGPRPVNTGAVLLAAPYPLAPDTSAGIFSVDTGRISAVRGLPTSGCLTNYVPGTDPGTWAATWHPGHPDDAPCAGRGTVFVVADGAATRRGSVHAAQYFVAGDHGTKWMVMGLELSAPDGEAGATVQHQSLDGTPLGPRLALPGGWVLMSGLEPDLLLLGRDTPRQESEDYISWQPSTRRTIASHDGLLGAGSGVVLSAPVHCMLAEFDCPVDVSAGRGNGVTAVTLPPGAKVNDVSVRADGEYVALTLITATINFGMPTEYAVMVIDVATGGSVLVKETRVSASHTVGLGTTWSGRSLVVLAPGAYETRQVGVYDPDRRAFAVSSGVFPAAHAWGE